MRKENYIHPSLWIAGKDSAGFQTVAGCGDKLMSDHIIAGGLLFQLYTIHQNYMIWITESAGLAIWQAQ